MGRKKGSYFEKFAMQGVRKREVRVAGKRGRPSFKQKFRRLKGRRKRKRSNSKEKIT